MQDFCNQLYVEMQQELEVIRSSDLPPFRQAERCFEICVGFSNCLRVRLQDYQFLSPEQEILFFKTIKPAFAAEQSFYRYCYYSILFRPSRGSEEMVKFLTKEKQRLETFRITHKTFYEYIKSGGEHLDSTYFRLHQGKTNKHTDLFTTKGDTLISELLALEKYTNYLRVEITRCRL